MLLPHYPRTTRRLWPALIVLLALSVGVVSGCKKRGDFKAGANAEMFTFVVSADPETFDTAKMSGAPEGRMAMNLFEGLMTPAPSTENLADASEVVRPGVAESYDVSPDGRTYTFRLRKDAKWSDGTSVTAHDFVYSWKRILTPGFPADYVSLFYLIEGAQEFNKAEEGEGDWDEVGIEALDDYTLLVRLRNPTPYFPELVAFYTFFPVPEAVVEEHGDRWTRPENIVTNGAYKLAAYEPQKELLLHKNEHYWGAEDVSLTEAKARIIQDRNAVTNAYRAQELHWSGASLPVSQISSFLTHPDFRRDPMLGTYYFRIAVSDEDSPLTDPKVRMALSLATDRESITDTTLNGLYQPATSYVPTNMAGWKPTFEVDYDPRRAKELLAEAGYPKGEGLPSIELLYNTDENHKLVAEAVQQMWNVNLGIDVRLVNKEWKMYLQDVDNINYDVARAGWIGDYNDPMTFLDMWETGNGNNDTGWSNSTYDRLLEEARAEPDVQKRLQILQQAEELLLREGPVIPVYFYTQNILVARHLEGFEPHNRDLHLLKYMSLAE